LAISSQPVSPLGDVTQEVLVEIFKHLDPPDLEKVSLVNQLFHRIALSDLLWKPIAQEINCPINENVAVYIQVKFFNIRKIINNFPGNPKDIQQIANNLQIPMIQRIKFLQEYRRARDIIVVWEKLAKKIKKKVPNLYKLKSSEKMINKSKGFNKWCHSHKNKLSRIQELIIHNSHLSSLPKEIGMLTQLQDLQLNNNYLSFLPPEIWELTQLNSIILWDNQLPFLPQKIEKLTELDFLDLSKNQLSSLPPEIGKLTKLNTLQLHNNQLTSLPEEIGNLTNLK